MTEINYEIDQVISFPHPKRDGIKLKIEKIIGECYKVKVLSGIFIGPYIHKKYLNLKKQEEFNKKKMESSKEDEDMINACIIIQKYVREYLILPYEDKKKCHTTEKIFKKYIEKNYIDNIDKLNMFKAYLTKNIKNNRGKLKYLEKLIRVFKGKTKKCKLDKAILEYIKGNKGEKGEIKIIEFLFDNMNNVKIINEIFSIKSRIKLIDPSTHEIIYDKESIKKSSWKNKADIIIYFTDISYESNVSIKCNDGAPPTLLNHTPLCAKCWGTERLKEYVPILTQIINKLNDKRKQGIYKEDIRYTDMKLTDKQEINTIINIISYFTFDGTGSSELFVGNSCNIPETSKFTNCETHDMKLEYIKNILPSLRFSLRGDKGMPSKKEKLEKCKPWIYEDIDKKGNIKLKGALHIRYI